MKGWANMKLFVKRVRKVMILLTTFIIITALVTGCGMFQDDIDADMDDEGKQSENRLNVDTNIKTDPDMDKNTNKNIDTSIGQNNKNEGVDIQAGNNEITKSKTEDKTGEIFIEVYYQDSEGYLIPVTKRIPRQLGVASASIKELINTRENREKTERYGLYPILPEETQFSINIKDGTAVIDFNKAVLEYNNEITERNIVASVVYTLTQFKTINDVKILVNGYVQQELKYGTDISGNLSRKNVLVNSRGSGSINLSSGMKKLDIYLFKSVKDKVYLLPVSIENMDINENDIQGEIIKYLGMPDNYGNLFSEIPEGLRLIGSSINKGLLTLNLDFDIYSYGGSMREIGMIDQILYSMKQVENVDRVRFLVDGEVKELVEGTDISQPIPLPSNINEITEL